MVYLLSVIVVATRCGRGPSLLASVLSVAAFDFFFVPPYFTFAVSDTQYLVTFSVMLVVALVISSLAVRIRAQAESARDREQRIAALYAMSRELASTRGVRELLRVAVRHITELFRARVVVLLPDAGGRLAPGDAAATEFPMDTSEAAVGQWVYEHGQVAGQGTDTLPGATGLYLPLLGSRGTVGVLGLRPKDPRALQAPEQLHQIETFASQTALAIERARLAEEAEQAQVHAETERLRNSLLSSVSHDLRTPLAAITGAASTLLENEAHLDAATRRDLLEALHEEADRLNRLVQNLLEMTRLEAGALQPQTEWHSVEEVVGAALGRFGKALAARPVTTRIPAELPLVQMDDVLIEQVLINLVDNALKYTPPGSPIEVTAEDTGSGVLVREVPPDGARPVGARRRTGAGDLPRHHPRPRRAHLGRESSGRRRGHPLHPSREGGASPADRDRCRLNRPSPRRALPPRSSSSSRTSRRSGASCARPSAARATGCSRRPPARTASSRPRPASPTSSSWTWACPTWTVCR
jgi:two-component system sensor histidine kinase KdpD